MKFLKFILLIILGNGLLYSQSKTIEEIDLTKATIYEYLNEYVADRKEEYKKFDSLGYLSVSLDYYNKFALKKDIKCIYSVKDQYVSIKLGQSDQLFPEFYGFINKKLVLFFNSTIPFKDIINKKSKKKIIKKINRSLSQKRHLVVYNANGKKIINDKNFFDEEEFNIHGGIILKVFGDNTIIVEDNNSNRSTPPSTSVD